VTTPQPLGDPVDFSGAGRPVAQAIRGQRVSLRPLDPARDAQPLYEISHEPAGDPTIWTYLYEGPYESLAAYRADLERFAASRDPLFYVVEVDGRPQGQATYLAIVPEHGTIEIGNLWFGPALQRTAAATEAIYLLASHAFDELGYRRLEWKCNSLNEPSRRAASRFGFLYEGTFSQHRVVKGCNRDTAWFAITDVRWPALKAGFERWLDPANFDSDGNQLTRLSDLLGG
jgi:RimJ/RimL family protein N-acetyltransferase